MLLLVLLLDIHPCLAPCVLCLAFANLSLRYAGCTSSYLFHDLSKSLKHLMFRSGVELHVWFDDDARSLHMPWAEPAGGGV